MRFSILLAAIVLGQAMTAQNLTNIESVEFDAVNHRFLVGNGNNIVEVDATGTPIAIFTGDSPKADYGMEVIGNTLFTIVDSSVRAYDLATGSQLSSITIAGALFLNGMASDGQNRVWVTDFDAFKIYELDYTDLANPSYTAVVANTGVGVTPNGICYDETNNRLVFVAWSGASSDITAVSLVDYALTTLVANASLNSIDGIDNDSEGNYYLASWAPQRITKYTPDFSVSEVITVAGGLNNPADIAYAEDIDTLLIPNSGNETVRIIGFQTSNVEGVDASSSQLACYPNPITENSVLTFSTALSGVVKVEILDMQGKTVHELLTENLPAAKHRIVVGELPIASGSYVWRVQTSGGEMTQAFVKQ
jgi:sugar lactone lactonase YvrE